MLFQILSIIVFITNECICSFHFRPEQLVITDDEYFMNAITNDDSTNTRLLQKIRDTFNTNYVKILQRMHDIDHSVRNLPNMAEHSVQNYSQIMRDLHGSKFRKMHIPAQYVDNVQQMPSVPLPIRAYANVIFSSLMIADYGSRYVQFYAQLAAYLVHTMTVRDAVIAFNTIIDSEFVSLYITNHDGAGGELLASIDSQLRQLFPNHMQAIEDDAGLPTISLFTSQLQSLFTRSISDTQLKVFESILDSFMDFGGNERAVTVMAVAIFDRLKQQVIRMISGDDERWKPSFLRRKKDIDQAIYELFDSGWIKLYEKDPRQLERDMQKASQLLAQIA